MRTASLTLCALALTSCATPREQAKDPAAATGAVEDAMRHRELDAPPAGAVLRDQQGQRVGSVELTQAPNGVVLQVRLEGVPAGERAFHIHEVGRCDPPFSSAGGHYNPKARQHGIFNVEGMHAGDFPNLVVPASGALEVTLFTDTVTLGEGPTSVFDGDGSALVIHVGPDDYRTDPAGNAGDRYACGVITR